MALTTIDDRGLKTPIDLLDNEKTRFGTGNDLEIYHDGSNNFIIGTSNTWIKNSGQQGFAAGSDYQVRCTADGTVELFYDNSKKFETTSSGVTVTGNYATTGWIDIDSDSSKLRLGDGQDLEIYHDGTNSFVYNTTGGLYLKSTNNAYIQVADGEEALRATANGATELKYDNTTKLQTTSTGTTTTGNATITGHIYQGDSDVHYFGAGPDLAIWHSGSHGFIRNTEGNLYIYSADGHDGHVVIQATYGEESVICEDNGAVKLYYDNSKKFETTSAGVSVTGTSLHTDNIKITVDNGALWVGAGDDLGIYHDGSHSYIKNTTGTLKVLADNFVVNDVDNGDNHLRCLHDGAVELYYDNSLRAYTSTNGFQVYKPSSDLVELRLVNDQNTTAGATNTITSQHDARTTAQIVFGRMNDANDFSAAAATTQGDIQFWTAQGGVNAKRATFINSGGLCFGTDTAAANALDDYEEGTFTPTLPSGGTISNYYSGYTRIGRVVNWWVYCYFSSVPDNTTTFKIGGIPFAISDLGGSGNYGGTGSFAYSSNFNVNKWNIVTWGGNDYINFYWNDTTASGASVKNESLTGATRYLALGGSYYA